MSVNGPAIVFASSRDEDEYCAVYIYRIPYSRRTTVTSCLTADSRLFINELESQIASDVDELEEGTWVDVTINALELVSVVVLIVVIVVAKKDSGNDADDRDARTAAPQSRPSNRRDTIFELPMDAVRI